MAFNESLNVFDVVVSFDLNYNPFQTRAYTCSHAAGMFLRSTMFLFNGSAHCEINATHTLLDLHYVGRLFGQPSGANKFVKQEHKNPNTNKFHEILDETMFHFIRGSNWGTPESPSLSEEENDTKIKNLSEEYNKLSKDYKIQ